MSAENAESLEREAIQFDRLCIHLNAIDAEHGLNGGFASGNSQRLAFWAGFLNPAWQMRARRP